MKPTVLFLFNSSQYAVQPWLDDGGFNVVSVDYSDTDHSAEHREAAEGHTVLNIDLSLDCAHNSVVDSLWALEMSQPSLVVAFPPCTDLAVCGNRSAVLKEKVNPNFREEAVQMARLAELFGVPYCIENPISRLATLWRKPNCYWQPFEYGGYCPEGEHPEFPQYIAPQDAYPKKSCSWTGNGFVMPQKRPVEVPEGYSAQYSKLGGKSARTKYIRSLTPRGFAQAIYEANRDNILSQWGTQVFTEYGTIQTQLDMGV